MTPLWLPFLTLVFGVFIGAVYNTYIRRPKLLVVGSGGGGIEPGCAASPSDQGGCGGRM